MGEHSKNLLIGVFVLAALAILVGLILFLHPKTGDQGTTLYVRFADLDKINVGTRVTLAGKPVGEVVAIKMLTDARGGRRDEFGHFYTYELELKIDSKTQVFDTDQISPRTSGLLGEKSIAIMPLAPQPGQIPRIITKDDTLYAEQPGSVEDTMREFKEAADRVEATLDSVILILEEVKKEDIVKKVSTTMQNISEITTTLNRPDELLSIIQNFQDFSEELATRLPPSWDRFDESLTSLKGTLANAENFSANADRVMYNVSQGQGSAGELLVRNDLSLRLNSLFNKGEVLFDDMNHYGLLYHLDKGWQRLRARRLNLMEKLCSPQEFRNFFNDEMDQILTSLSRVERVMEKMECCAPTCALSDCEFSKVFSELLRRVTGLEEALQLYNQGAVECQVYQTEL